MVGQVDGHREDDGGVVLGRDAVQSLEVAQLKQGSQVNAHKSVNQYFNFNQLLSFPLFFLQIPLVFLFLELHFVVVGDSPFYISQKN